MVILNLKGKNAMTKTKKCRTCNPARIGKCWGCGKPVFSDQSTAHVDITFPGQVSVVENLKPIHDNGECLSHAVERQLKEFHDWQRDPSTVETRTREGLGLDTFTADELGFL